MTGGAPAPGAPVVGTLQSTLVCPYRFIKSMPACTNKNVCTLNLKPTSSLTVYVY